MLEKTSMSIISDIEIIYILAKQHKWERNQHVKDAFKRVLDKVEPHQYNQSDSSVIDLAIIMIALYKIYLDNKKSLPRIKTIYEDAYRIYKQLKPINADLYKTIKSLDDDILYLRLAVLWLIIFLGFVISILFVFSYLDIKCLYD